jgi:serine/threonine protein kinase
MDPSAKYKLLEQVGNGSFGVVYKAVNKETGEVVAIKEVCAGIARTDRRLILRAGMTILPRFSRRLLC